MAGRAVANRSEPAEGPNTERAGRRGPAAVALAAGWESMGVGVARSPGGAARLAAGTDSARGDPPGDVTGAG